MAVLSIDLAARNWSDLGVVVLERCNYPYDLENPSRLAFGGPLDPFRRGAESMISCEILFLNAPGRIDANILAGRLNHLCGTRNIRVLMLDGPQAWKSQHNGLEHARAGERQLNTPAKTGLPGMVKPITLRPFAEFCMDVFDGLCRRGWRRLDTREHPGDPAPRILVETSPQAAWKSLGLKPLPSKRRTRVSDLARAFASLHRLFPITVNRPPNYDQLQAIIGGLPGLALEECDPGRTRIVGNPPRREQGHWREGFIVLPVPPRPTAGLRWLN